MGFDGIMELHYFLGKKAELGVKIEGLNFEDATQLLFLPKSPNL